MSRKPAHTARYQGRRNLWSLVAVGALVLGAGVLAFSIIRSGSSEPAADLAPDITLTALQGDFQLSRKRGEAVALYFSFVG